MSGGFTPGPWTYRRVESGDPRSANSLVYCQIGPVGALEKARSVAYAGTYGKDVTGSTAGVRQSDEECEANARLIAAAPELYEALSDFVSDCTNEECERCIKARAALAKARGEDA